MKTRLTRILALLLVLCSVISLYPATVFAAEDDAAEAVPEETQISDSVPGFIDCGFSRDAFVNPLYADILDVDDPEAVLPAEYSGDTLAATGTEYLSDEEIIATIRSSMEAREDTVVVYYQATDKYSASYFSDFITDALEETGVSTQGDYLRWAYSGVRVSVRYAYSGGIYRYQVTYSFGYYTTAAQEAELTEAIDALLEQLNIPAHASDYYKLKAVYDYICSNISYDYENLNNSSYTLKYTAYAALINKTSVCQGYATLLYRLLTELGISTRYISGTGDGVSHGWNIVKLGDCYYNVDVTWDASYLQGGAEYAYFLKSSSEFGNHVRSSEYATAAFMKAYPMSSTSYIPQETDATDHTWDTGTVIREATCTQTGLISYACTGCGETYTETLPLTAHSYQAVTTAPTCTEQGYTLHACAACGDNYTDGETPALGHAWDTGTVIREATYDADGLISYTCTGCSQTRTEALPKLGTPLALFTDIDPSAYYIEALSWAVEQGITTGVGANSFAPGRVCSRAQIVTMLWRNAGEPEPAIETPFCDVPEDAYYSKAVLWAYEQGITTGTSSSTFSPDEICTRSQIVTLLWRAEGCPQPEARHTPFTDAESDSFYYTAMLWAYEQGITSGVSDTSFAPANSCSRGEAVTFLHRYVTGEAS